MNIMHKCDGQRVSHRCAARHHLRHVPATLRVSVRAPPPARPPCSYSAGWAAWVTPTSTMCGCYKLDRARGVTWLLTRPSGVAWASGHPRLPRAPLMLLISRHKHACIHLYLISLISWIPLLYMQYPSLGHRVCSLLQRNVCQHLMKAVTAQEAANGPNL